MTSLRWLKLNHTGLCYLPEELAALQKLVSGQGMGLLGGCRAKNLLSACLMCQRLIIGLSEEVWLKLDAGVVRKGAEAGVCWVSPCFLSKPDQKPHFLPLPVNRREG